MKPKKTDKVREAIANGNWKEALRIAKDFRINVTKEQRSDMTRAYECIVHPNFYRELGTNIDEAIAKGQRVLETLYGA